MKIKTNLSSYSINLRNQFLDSMTEVSEKTVKETKTSGRIMNNHSVPVMGFSIYGKDLNNLEFSSAKTVINTINAHSYCVARKDRDFQRALLSSDILIADGFPIVMAAKMLDNNRINKIAGEDMFFHLLNKLNRSSGSCFFLGSSEKTLEKIKDRIQIDYPNIKPGFFSPPYKEKFSEEDNAEMISQVNSFRPDVLFVGMTAPKQEKWVHENSDRIDANIICSIGAVFDFYARNIKRPSGFWVALRMEWFVRLVKEPKRLWRRYLVSSPIFFKYLFLYKTGILKNNYLLDH